MGSTPNTQIGPVDGMREHLVHYIYTRDIDVWEERGWEVCTYADGSVPVRWGPTGTCCRIWKEIPHD